MPLFYPITATLNRTLDEEIHNLEVLDDEIFVPLLANGIRGNDASYRPLTRDQLIEDRQWVAYCHDRSAERGDLADALVADPAAFRQRFISVLRAFDEAFFKDEWPNSKARLEAVCASLNSKLKNTALVPLLESLSRIASSRESATDIYFDKLQSRQATVGEHGMVLVPSLRGWPYLIVKTDAGMPVVVHFLAQEFASEVKAQSQENVRRRLLILAEPGRWDICRHLLGESVTTTELAKRAYQTVPAVSRPSV